MVSNITPSKKSTCINFITEQRNKTFSMVNVDSKWCVAVNALVVKNVKDANVPLKLLPMRREYVMLY